MKISQKKQFDAKVIDSAIQKASENNERTSRELKTHIVYAGYYYYPSHRHQDKLKSFIHKGIKNSGINSVLLTKMILERESNHKRGDGGFLRRKR